MSEEQNIEEGSKEQGTRNNIEPEVNKETAEQHFPEDSHAPQPQTINDKPETENMEVHHHSHSHGKKNWKTYIWEFLMLFLAVFCGFLAEYKLEHLIEHQREKEYAKALYDEFLADSMVVADRIHARLEKEKDCDYLSNYIRDSSLTELPKEFYAAYTTVFYLINSYKFEPKDGILSQLKASGSLRYFKNTTLQKLFGDISVAISNIRYRNEQEYQFFADPIKPFILKHYDFKWIDAVRKLDTATYYMPLINKYRESDTIIKASILNLPSFDRGEVVNMIMFYKTMLISSRTLHMNEYIVANRNLLKALRENYSLENE